MRKVHMILLSIFAAGVLLGGIGTGIAFGEYAGMEYGGTVILGEEDMVEGKFTYEFEPVEGKKLVINPYYGAGVKEDVALKEDETIPMGQICYEVVYNDKQVAPKISHWEAGEEEEEVSGYVELHTRFIGNEMENFLENKDRVLKDIKEKRLTSYEFYYVRSVEIRVNPDMMEYIENRTQY